MKLIQIAFALFFVNFSLTANAETISYSAGEAYCALTHPVEFVFKLGNKVSTCEEQHVIQRQAGGGDIANVVWWPASHHVRTDVAGSRPWQNSRPWFVLGFTDDNKTNLEKAYMLGTHGLSWSLFQHSYKGYGDSNLIAFEFDGVSNVLYGVSWVLNIPQKFIHQTAYLVDKGHWHLLIDMLILIFVLMIEMVIALVMTVVGLFAGTVLNPIDTLFAIPGGLWLVLETFVAAVFQTFSGIWAMVTSGIVGIILTPFTIIGSLLPFMFASKLGDR